MNAAKNYSPAAMTLKEPLTLNQRKASPHRENPVERPIPSQVIAMLDVSGMRTELPAKAENNETVHCAVCSLRH